MKSFIFLLGVCAMICTAAYAAPWLDSGELRGHIQNEQLMDSVMDEDTALVQALNQAVKEKLTETKAKAQFLGALLGALGK